MLAQPDPDLLKRIRAIQAHPILSSDEELRLTRAWRDRRAESARRRIIQAHQRICVMVARKYAGYGADLGDLLSEGDIGLIQALDRFDPERGFRFSTLATYWVTAFIRAYTMKNWSMVVVKNSKNHRKLFFQLRQVMRQLNIHDHGKGVSSEELTLLATTLEVPASDIESMLLRFRSPDLSIDAPTTADGDWTWLDTLSADSRSIEDDFDSDDVLRKHRSTLIQVLESLKPREKSIFIRRYVQKPSVTLEELATIHNVSRERIRQIGVIACDKIKKALLKIEHAQALERQAAFRNFKARGAFAIDFDTQAAPATHVAHSAALGSLSGRTHAG